MRSYQETREVGSSNPALKRTGYARPLALRWAAKKDTYVCE